MSELRSFQMFLILMIPFAAAVTQHRSFIIVRVGDEATLSCKDVKDYQNKCFSTTWIFNYLITGAAVTLFENGKVKKEAASKSDRLSVTEKCSLVIKNITDEDVGRYICRQFISGQIVPETWVDLSADKTGTQHYSRITARVGNEAALPCENITDPHDKCLTITWMFSDSTNRPSVTLFEFGQIHREAAAKSDRLSVTEKCSLVIKKVTYEDVGHYTCRQFISGQPVTDSQVDLSVVQRDNIATPPPPPTTTILPTTTKRTTEITKATTRPTTTTDSAADLLKVLIPVAVLAALLIIAVAVIRWKRVKENNSWLDNNNADPPDGVSYASIRYKKKTKSKAQGEDDTVTYSTLNTSSISAGASTDPRNLYASINKTNT